ncbi:hypothetical protein NNG64_11400 [Bacillus siamensis]|uniref:Uncharacterized protein n=1 Tax=Bacillus siamensis TaxID=659243 RepID=A0AAI8N133_9BACI|nr:MULTISPECIES: hypothetical protein [Bacillus]AME05692.1 hypothetical protein AUL54_04655 [Bacillus sp. SDLI1]AUJ78119.1 hypothetical protein CWD84_15435 [Bacillus siamensis]UUA82747.1 hypothetical protein NNG64_11400 [Bacillus siamensis]
MFKSKSISSFIFLSELDKLEDLYIEQEEHNEKSLLSWEVFLESNTEGFTDEEIYEFVEWYSADYLKYSNDYPQVIRKTIFLQTYFSFEGYLNNLCSDYKKKLDTDLDYKDMRGQGIERAKLYLTKVCNVTIPFLTDEWKLIKSYNMLRNALVHNNSIIDKSNLKTIPKGVALNSYSEEKISTNYYLELEKEFLDDAFLTYRAFSIIIEQQ